MIGALVAALLIGVIWAPDTKGKSLEQIEQERYGEPAKQPVEQTTA
jgi:inositol transporter-like SP family MFS transporter